MHTRSSSTPRMAFGLLLVLATAACSSSAAPSGGVATPGDPAATSPATPAVAATPDPTANPTAEPTIEPTPAASAALEITGPEGATFAPRQARMYVGTLSGADGLVNEYGGLAECHWRFYLNERDEEALVAEMENRSSLGPMPEGQEVCGFTTTFIEGRGELRVELTLEVTTIGGDVIDTLVAERTYTVK